MSCIVLIPIYKDQLDPNEERNIQYSLENLTNGAYCISWLAPLGIKKDYYDVHFPSVAWSMHPPEYFRSIKDYSRLLLTDDFYKTYHNFEWMLILQPDAVILKPTLADWLDMPYDYIGAPWPNGWEYPLPIQTGEVVNQIRCRAFVGNGGLSLRRSKKVISLLNEFPDATRAWHQIGNPEDLLISMLATLSTFFLVPNIRIAAQFSIELDYPLLNMMNCRQSSFGAHGALVDELFKTRSLN
jgi:hypothetical protein